MHRRTISKSSWQVFFPRLRASITCRFLKRHGTTRRASLRANRLRPRRIGSDDVRLEPGTRSEKIAERAPNLRLWGTVKRHDQGHAPPRLRGRRRRTGCVVGSAEPCCNRFNRLRTFKAESEAFARLEVYSAEFRGIARRRGTAMDRQPKPFHNPLDLLGHSAQLCPRERLDFRPLRDTCGNRRDSKCPGDRP